MSVLIPTFSSTTNSNHSHYVTRSFSHTTKPMSLNSKLNEDMNHDHVPHGVVSSMKQRFLSKINESLSINNRDSIRLSSNENLFQIKSQPRLSRSQDSLLNNHTDPLTPYLTPKKDVVIVDTTTTTPPIHSYIELHIDETPKPGTVTTVKNMFERQIRLSRYDSEKVTTPRVNHYNRDIISPSRSRSISPNDMALRQKRTVLIPTSYPDLVISHTPPNASTTSQNEINNEQYGNENKNKDDELIMMNINHNLLLPSSSSSSQKDVDYQPLDFKSRLALFNRINTVERSNENVNIKKTSIPPPVPSFLTKPIVHHHTEKKDLQSDVKSVNGVIFFGGIHMNGSNKSTLPSTITPPLPMLNKDEQLSMSAPTDLFRSPDFIGGNVKLSKSSIFSGTKKDTRVKFTENVDTFEYPSFNIAMTESDSDSEDKTTPTNKHHDIHDDLVQLSFKNENNLTEKLTQSKGTLHTFRPTYIDQYELGSQRDSFMNRALSDKYFHENYFNLLENFSTNTILKQEKSAFDMTNNIPWSSMSTTTDLLF